VPLWADVQLSFELAAKGVEVTPHLANTLITLQYVAHKIEKCPALDHSLLST
jgi:hypothetical protein